MKKLSKESIAALETKVAGKTKKEVKADKATKAAVVKKITNKKDLVYKYPADCDDLTKRKTFRAKIRKQLVKLEKALRLITKGKKDGRIEDVEKEIEAFKNKYYHPSKD